jgi:hypothetical protein
MKITIFNPNPFPYRGPVEVTIPGSWGSLLATTKDGDATVTRPLQAIEGRRYLLIDVDLPALGTVVWRATESSALTAEILDAPSPQPDPAVMVGQNRVASRGRHGNFVFEFWWEMLSPDVGTWELLVNGSDPTVPDLAYPLDELSIVATNGWIPFSIHSTTFPADGRLVLPAPSSLPDSTCVAYRGTFLRDPPLAVMHGLPFMTPIAVCDAWLAAWPPLPHPVMEANLAALRGEAETVALRFLLTRADQHLGLEPNGNQTGSQGDFGVCGGLGAFAHPAFLMPMIHSALQEARRTGYWREADGSIVDPGAHPNHVTWDGYTHFSSSVSSDRLGKTGAPTTNYKGPDREHWSINNLASAALLTDSPLLKRLLDRNATLVLSGETLDRRLSTSGAGAPRGIGRTNQMVEQLLAASDSVYAQRAGQRQMDRLRQIILPSVLTNVGAYGTCLGTIFDDRAMGSTVAAVAVWQEALGIVGLACGWTRWIHDVSDPRRRILEAILPGWLQHGWWQDQNGWHMADYVRFDNPSVRLRNEGFEEWAIGALEVAAYLSLSVPSELRSRAAVILASMRDRPRAIREANWRCGPYALVAQTW